MTHSPPHTAANDETDPSAERAERHMRLLAELAKIGMEMVREVRRQLAVLNQPRLVDDTATAPASLTDLALAYSRIARAVRQTIALEARIEADERARVAGLQIERAARRAEAANGAWIEGLLRTTRDNQVGRAVEKAIDAGAKDKDDFERLLDGFCERLNDDEAYAGWDDRPVGEIVAGICKDLGLTPDWSLWADEDWAMEAVMAHGSPDAPDTSSDGRSSSHAKQRGAGKVDSRSEDAAGAAPKPPPP